MKVEEIKEYNIWQSFFDENNSPSFLQSWEWGEFEKETDYEIIRLGIFEKNSLKAIGLVIKIKAKRGNFLFIPHGPIFQTTILNHKSKIKFSINLLLNYLTTLAKKEGYSFIRIAPILDNTPENQKIFSDLGFKKARIYMHAERLWILNLTSKIEERSGKTSEVLYKTDEQLLNEMRKTTRYLVRKANRDGVIIEKRTDKKTVDDFWKIYEETARREKFVPFSKDFIRKEFEAFNKTGNAIFLFGSVPTIQPTPGVGETDTKPTAAALIIFTKSTAFYHQGASIHTKIPATYLLQWEAIKEARQRGCQFYNFWGIHQEGRTPKSWTGLTLFKTGFGGKQIDYFPTQDYIISPKYYLTYIYEKFLEWRRGV